MTPNIPQRHGHTGGLVTGRGAAAATKAAIMPTTVPSPRRRSCAGTWLLARGSAVVDRCGPAGAAWIRDGARVHARFGEVLLASGHGAWRDTYRLSAVGIVAVRKRSAEDTGGFCAVEHQQQERYLCVNDPRSAKGPDRPRRLHRRNVGVGADIRAARPVAAAPSSPMCGTSRATQAGSGELARDMTRWRGMSDSNLFVPCLKSDWMYH
jgi:hypothetical protein